VAGQAWAAATTEGLLIYSLDAGMVFDPFLLDESVTPVSIRKTLQDGDWPKGRGFSRQDILHFIFPLDKYKH